MSYIFVQQLWHRDPIYPSFRVIPRNGGQFSEIPLSIGDDLNIKITGKRYCIGTDHEIEGWITCVRNQQLNPHVKQNIIHDNIVEREVTLDSVQCLMCRSDDYYSCRKTCNGDTCKYSSIKAFNRCQLSDTAIYLTHIAGELKVGVSLRTESRWLDQGSDYGTVIAYAPGLEARKIERQLGSALDLKLSINSLSKMRNLQAGDKTFVEEEMRSIHEKAIPILKKTLSGTEGYILNEIDIIDFTSFYGNSSVDKAINVVDIQENLEFGGEIHAIKGPLLIVKQNMYLFGLDTKTIIGNEFQFLDRQANLTNQRSLEEWF